MNQQKKLTLKVETVRILSTQPASAQAEADLSGSSGSIIPTKTW